MQVTPHGGLANRCTRPLCDLSVATAAGILSWATLPSGRPRPARDPGPATKEPPDGQRRAPEAPHRPDRQRARRPSAVPRASRSTSSARASMAGASSSATSRSRRRSTPRRSSTSWSTTTSSSTCRRSRRPRRVRIAAGRGEARPRIRTDGRRPVRPRGGRRHGGRRPRGFEFLQWFIAEQVEEETEAAADRRPDRQRHQPVPGRGPARRVRVGHGTEPGRLHALRDDRRAAARRRADLPRRLRPGVAGPLRARGGADPRGCSASASLLLEHVGSTSVPGPRGQADHRHASWRSPTRPTSAPTSPSMEAGGYAVRIREPDWLEHGSSRARTRTSTCTSSARGRPRSTGCSPSATGCAPTTTSGSDTRRPSASWPPASGSTSRTTPMRRARSSKASSSGPSPIDDGTPGALTCERGNRYRPGTHMNHLFLLSMPGMIVPGR